MKRKDSINNRRDADRRMESTRKKSAIHERVCAILEGKKPDCLPFIDRLEIWYKHHTRTGTLPEQFKGMSLTEVHRAVGIGQEKFLSLHSIRLRGVEVISRFEGETCYRETDPVLDSFPRLSGLIQEDRAGVTVTEFITPVGALSVQHQILDEMIDAGVVPYMKEPLIKEEADYRTVEYILERAEYVPQYEMAHKEEARLGDIGFLVPALPRIPFQQILIDYLGTIPLFNALYDSPQLVKKLLTLLNDQLIEVIYKLAEWPGPYVEFIDNLHAEMTNPRLFAEYCLPYYQRYTEILHGQGKKVGSHTDGNVKPLLRLLAKSGLDICESFSPVPLTECTFEEAWDAWKHGPIIWGGIPSPMLEERTNKWEFQEYILRLLQTITDRPIILGVGDMIMGNNLIERVGYIAQRVEDHAMGGRRSPTP
jgi:hypothetical protein